MLRLEGYIDARDKIYRISNVQEHSPAQLAGLIQNDDYLLGITQTTYNNIEDLINYLLEIDRNSVIKSLELCIYNTTKKDIRFTYVLPNRGWGGKGCIGCEFAAGYLNELPWFEKENECFNITFPKEISGVANTQNPNQKSIKESNIENQKIGPPPTKTNEQQQSTHTPHSLTHETADSTVHYLAEKKFRRKHSDEHKDKHNREIIKDPFSQPTHTPQSQSEPVETEIIEFQFEIPQEIEQSIPQQEQITNSNAETISESTEITVQDFKQPELPQQPEQPQQQENQEIQQIEEQTIQRQESKNQIAVEQRGQPNQEQTIEYKFECQKLGGVYIIKSNELFDLTVTLHKQSN